MFPAHAEVERQRRPDLPVVLEKDALFIVVVLSFLVIAIRIGVAQVSIGLLRILEDECLRHCTDGAIQRKQQTLCAANRAGSGAADESRNESRSKSLHRNITGAAGDMGDAVQRIKS